MLESVKRDSCRRKWAFDARERREEERRSWMVVRQCRSEHGRLILTTLLLVILLGCAQLEAKTHHSKRQAPAAPSGSQAQTSSTGRENTNWWNIWWQQYIDEAVQPTVRPIVAVSFNGNTIRLPEESQASASSPLANNRDQRDVEANLALNNLALDGLSSTMDLERQERMRDIASSLPSSMHPSLAAKQILLAQRKSGQQQAIKPTIIQMPVSGVESSARRASQKELQPEMGIQMRASMNRQRQNSDRVEISDDYNQMPTEFEQQQNQMADYAEETDSPEVMGLDGNSAQAVETSQQNSANDSSSSMLMNASLAERKPSPGMGTSQQLATEGSSDRSMRKEVATNQPTANMMIGRAMQRPEGREEEQVGSSGKKSSQTGLSQDTTIGRPQHTSSETLKMSSLEQIAGTTFSPMVSGKPNTREPEVTETAISREEEVARIQEGTSGFTSTTSTPTSATVELTNGKPATGSALQRQQAATTTSSRLPTLSGQSRNKGNATSAPTKPFATPTSPLPTSSLTLGEQTSTTAQPTRTTVGEQLNKVGPTQTASIMQANSARPSMLSSKDDDRAPATSRPDSEPEEDDAEEETDTNQDTGSLLKTDANAEGEDDNSENADDEEDQLELNTTSSPMDNTLTSSPQNFTLPKLEPPARTSQQASKMVSDEVKKMTSTGKERMSEESPRFVMMTLGAPTKESESSFSVPMDALMRMMMNQMAIEETIRIPTTTTTVSPTMLSKLDETRNTQASSRQPESQASNSSEKLIEGPASTTRAKSGKLQPPPTTTTPARLRTTLRPTTKSVTRDESITTPKAIEMLTTSRPKEPKTIVNVTTEEEPNIEILNLDLIPIQRMISNPDDKQQRAGKELDNKMRMKMASLLLSNETEGTDIKELSKANMMEQMMEVNVEPGMRLRPSMGVAVEPSEQRTQVKTGPQIHPNNSNTLQMVVMNNGHPQHVLVGSSSSQTSTSKKPSLGGMIRKVSLDISDAKSASSQPPNKGSISPTNLTVKLSQEQSSQPTNIEAFNAVTIIPSFVQTGSSSSQTILQSNQVTTIQPDRVIVGNRANNNSQQQFEPSSLSSPFSSKNSMQTLMLPIDQSNRSPNERARTMMVSPSPNNGTQKIASSSPTQASLIDSTSIVETTTSITTNSIGMSKTDTPNYNLHSMNNSGDLNESNAGRQATNTSSSLLVKLRQKTKQKVNIASDAKQAIPSPAITKLPQSKTAEVSNLNATFIPSKLRKEFHKAAKPDYQTPNETSSEAAELGLKQEFKSSATKGQAQNMAIRQFGGANRMSVLAKRPVPFGRPATMTMKLQDLQGVSARRQVPNFEYGPSIAVRRPDEPLANGQVPNCTLAGKNFCVLTNDYPMNEVRQAVERSFRSVRIMYEELQTVSDQELHKDDFNSTNNQAASGRFACQTQVEMMRPGWAKDEITKEWMLVVNTDVFPQRVRTESCAQPNTPCEFIAPFYDSTCQQRYSLHRMIAIDPHDPSRSPQVAVFRFPAGCVCRVHPIKKSMPHQTMLTH